MDIKIGLLVKNRITLQDVVTTSQQVKKKDKKHNRTSVLLDGALPGGVGGFSKANQEMIEVYCVCVVFISPMQYIVGSQFDST